MWTGTGLACLAMLAFSAIPVFAVRKIITWRMQTDVVGRAKHPEFTMAWSNNLFGGCFPSSLACCIGQLLKLKIGENWLNGLIAMRIPAGTLNAINNLIVRIVHNNRTASRIEHGAHFCIASISLA